jgi:hypothetical protein
MKQTKGIIKPNDAPLHIIQRINAKFGRIDYKRDFLSADLKTYFKTVEHDDSRKYSAQLVLKL